MQPVYRSTDTGAPQITNTNGSLVTVLDAVLVNGYDAKAGLGWTIEHTASNKRVYKQGAGSSGFCLRVDDSGNVYHAAVRGAESFSDIDTYSGGFPTAAQFAAGLYIQKSNNIGGDRAWVIFGDAKRFVLLVQSLSSNANVWTGFFFGDIVSFKAGDAYATLIMGKVESRSDAGADNLGITNGANAFSIGPTGHYMPRGYTGAGSAVRVGKYTDGRHTNIQAGQGTPGGGGGSSNTQIYPDPISGGLHLSRFFVNEGTTGSYAPRGYIPGIWCVCHDATQMFGNGVGHGDTFNGTDGLASRSFEMRYLNAGTSGSSSNFGAIAIETSDWPESA